jgi:hypothetical protein
LLAVVAVLLGGWGGGVREDGRASAAAGTTVDITGSDQASLERFVQAVGTPGTTVRLAPDVALDVTGHPAILIAAGVTVTSWRSAVPGRASPIRGPDGKELGGEARTPLLPGPRIYTTKPNGVFELLCTVARQDNPDHVRISGLRLLGANQNVVDDDAIHPIAIKIDSCVDIEISNMEIAGWSGSGIYVDDTYDRLGTVDQIRIHDNFIHNNQHEGREGYGVAVEHGAWARIERNAFDFNRHAIKADGNAGGYWAEQNLVLKGGGYHRLGFHTHLFDVHGNDNCGFRGLFNDAAWNCGQAAWNVWILRNAFQYVQTNAVKIRGTPRYRASIVGNVFAHTANQEAVGLTEGTKNIELRDNVKGFDPYGRYGVCDFDGDGIDDLFLATGTSWWFSSGGRRQWSYLFDATERLYQVRLAYVDGDPRCDVVAQGANGWSISSGGRGEWRSLGNFGAPLSEVVLGRFGGPPDAIPGRTRQATHAFRRAPNGQWYVTPLSSPAWQPVQSSSFPLSALHFGDFTGDGITDVLAVVGGRWAISESATGPWQRLNTTVGTDLSEILIADVDNDNRDDILRMDDCCEDGRGTWEVSWGGRTPWTKLAALTGLSVDYHAAEARSYIYRYAGRFDTAGGRDLLVIGGTRFGRFYSRSTGEWQSDYRY